MVFYVLDTGKATYDNGGYCQFDLVGKENVGELPRCPVCNTAIGAKPWLPPYKVKIKGKELSDFCSSGYGREFLFSYRFAAKWKEEGLLGFELLDDNVSCQLSQSLKKQLIHPYVLMRSHITLTLLDEKASGMEISKFVGCETCRVAQRQRVKRLVIDESTWNGSDIFYPSGLYGALVVTQRFVDLVKSNKFTNFWFIHQDQYQENWE